MTCSIEDCGSRVLARGWCQRHYARWYRHGTTELRPRSLVDPIATFLDRLEIGPSCWTYAGGHHANGYVAHSLGGSGAAYGHRFAYELFVGPIADGLVIDHLCNNKGCVNPDHLQAVTQGENVRRYYEDAA